MSTALDHRAEKRESVAANSDSPKWFGKWTQYLLEQVDGSSLAAFRISFAVLMILGLIQFSRSIPEYTHPFHFSFISGLPMLTPQGATILFAVMAFCAGNIGLGFFYRVSSLVFCLASSYLLLLDKAYYQNQLYLICLLSFLLFIVPGNKVCSLDNNEGRAPHMVPRWSVLVFRTQIAIIYFFSGIAKLNSDWINGYPQLFWIMKHKQDPFLHALGQNLSMSVITYGAITIDLLAAVLLLSRRTCWIGVSLIVFMHSVNYSSFLTGIFPWLIFAGLTLFGPPAWPRKLLQLLDLGRLRKSKKSTGDSCSEAALTNTSVTDQKIGLLKSSNSRRGELCLLTLVHVYILCQILVPLRQFMYPRNTSWGEFGNRFSWALLLPGKEVKEFSITAIDERTGAQHKIASDKVLGVKQYNAMITHPDLILQFAHEIARQELRKTGVKPIINVRAVESLNSRPEQDLVNPNIDLASQPVTFLSPSWVVPLSQSRQNSR